MLSAPPILLDADHALKEGLMHGSVDGRVLGLWRWLAVLPAWLSSGLANSPCLTTFSLVSTVAHVGTEII